MKTGGVYVGVRPRAFRSALKAAGMSQRGLARATGVSVSTISNLTDARRARRLALAKAEAITAALGADPTKLWTLPPELEQFLSQKG